LNLTPYQDIDPSLIGFMNQFTTTAQRPNFPAVMGIVARLGREDAQPDVVFACPTRNGNFVDEEDQFP
jgi:hypothetical protein